MNWVINKIFVKKFFLIYYPKWTHFVLEYFELILAESHFIRFIDLGVDFYDISCLEDTFFPSCYFQTTTFLPKTHVCKGTEPGDSN